MAKLKLKLSMLAAVSLLGGYLLGGLLYAQVNLLTNGDFETGDINGWTQFTTEFGSLGAGYPMVGPFDTNGDGTATNSAQFSVGQSSAYVKTAGVSENQGGGLYQTLDLAAGDYSLTADIAAGDEGSNYGNGKAGLFELLLDGVVMDSEDLGPIGANATKHSMLVAMPGVSAGMHEIRIRITRPAGEATTLTQYLDNITLVQTGSTDPQDVPDGSDTPSDEDQDCRGNRGGNRDSGNNGGDNNKDGQKHCD
ncbi:MAG: hypothetical protein BZY88_14165 [SAR202 cluster bacterium Io17-Chloro-G9]|nr:MAG: hypothetical protein BZY88_14165 [SAR202 cluster bacterium Io17-Chloro-G9]